jgi:hypothetical protein
LPHTAAATIASSSSTKTKKSTVPPTIAMAGL